MRPNLLNPVCSLVFTVGAKSLPQCTQSGVFDSILFPHSGQVVQDGTGSVVSISPSSDTLRDVPHALQNRAASGLSLSHAWHFISNRTNHTLVLDCSLFTREVLSVKVISEGVFYVKSLYLRIAVKSTTVSYILLAVVDFGLNLTN